MNNNMTRTTLIPVLIIALSISLLMSGVSSAQTESGGALSIPFSGEPGAPAFVREYSEYYPYGFKISPDGSLFLSNTHRGTISQYDFMGRLIKTYGAGAGLGKTGDITFDPEGMIYYADLAARKVVKIDMLGQKAQEFGSFGERDDNLLSIYQIETAPGKKLFVQDLRSSKINVYAANGSFVKKVDCDIPGFAVTAKGQLLFFKKDYPGGFGFYLLDPGSKAPQKLFEAGLYSYRKFIFIGVDYRGNILVAADLTGESEYYDILIFYSWGALSHNYQVKKSPMSRQFFVFGDGSLYSAEVDGSPQKPQKISVRRY